MDLMRRLPKALLVTLAAALLFGGGLGFAVAAGSSGVPDTLQIAEPHVGDRWQYDSTMRFLFNGVEEDVDRETALLEWRPSEVVYDEDGRSRHVQPLLLDATDSEGFRYFIDHETQRVVAFSMKEVFNETRSMSLLPFVSLGSLAREEAAVQYNASLTAYGDEPVVCGSFTDLQGQNVSLDEPIEVVGGCLGWDKDQHVTRFQAFETRTFDGLTTVGFEATDGRNTTRLWFAPNVPYPVRMSFEIDTILGVLFPMVYPFATADASLPVFLEVEIRLTGFEAGAGEWGVPSGGLLPPRPPVDVAPMTRTGPDDGGIDHPYPLSEAFAGARDDPLYSDLRDFLATHPDARVVQARGWTTDEDGWTVYGWEMMVWESGDDIEVVAERRIGDEGSALGLVQEATGPQDEHRTRDDGVLGFDFTIVDPEALPDTAPRVVDAASWFEAATGTPITTYGFDYTCTLFCWGDEHAALIVGSEQEEHEPADPVTGEPGTITVVRHMAYFDAEGDLVWEERYAGEGETQTAILGPTGIQSAEGSEERKVVPARAVWAPPPAEAAAGITFLAFLIGAAYWLWPAIKTGGLWGLFSRVHGQELLQNPTRASIYEAVRKQPGIHYQGLVRETGKGQGAVEHHVRKLQQSGFIVSQSNRGYTCFFPKGQVDRSVMAAVPFLKSEGAAKVLRHILQQQPRTISQVASELGIAKSTASHHVRRLREAGLLEASGPIAPTAAARKALTLAA